MTTKILIGLLILIGSYAFYMREYHVPQLEKELEYTKKDYQYLIHELEKLQQNPQIVIKTDTMIIKDTLWVSIKQPVEKTDSSAVYFNDFNYQQISGTIISFIKGKHIQLEKQALFINSKTYNTTKTITQTIVTPIYWQNYKKRLQSRNWRLQVGGFVYTDKFKNLTFGPQINILSPRDNNYFIGYNPFEKSFLIGTSFTIRL